MTQRLIPLIATAIVVGLLSLLYLPGGGAHIAPVGVAIALIGFILYAVAEINRFLRVRSYFAKDRAAERRYVTLAVAPPIFVLVCLVGGVGLRFIPLERPGWLDLIVLLLVASLYLASAVMRHRLVEAVKSRGWQASG